MTAVEDSEIFRHDTFGDEQLWTDQLRLHEAIETTLSPQLALQLGLKVDVDALPDALIEALTLGQVDLTDPAVTVALIKLDAVVGVKGTVEPVDGKDRLTSVGITCALCHSTVDDSFIAGIGSRLDGWANVNLDPGKIIAAAPGTDDAKRPIYESWGPGKYDPRFNIDGLSTPIVIPPAYGLADIDKETFTGEGPVSYWNRYVAVTQMGGQGSFFDPRLRIFIFQFPDRVHFKLPALRRLSVQPGDAAAARGQLRSGGRGAGQEGLSRRGQVRDLPHPAALHRRQPRIGSTPRAETGMDPAYARRTTTKRYRTTPLRALWQHPPYFHDGSAATLNDVVEHYNTIRRLNLTEEQKLDLVEFLKSL